LKNWGFWENIRVCGYCLLVIEYLGFFCPFRVYIIHYSRLFLGGSFIQAILGFLCYKFEGKKKKKNWFVVIVDWLLNILGLCI
jgi:hypothetical protein